MRRPQPAFWFAAVIAGLLAVTVTPALAHASRAIEQEVDVATSATPQEAAGRREASIRSGRAGAPSQCTGHRSERNPPATIRVLRTKRSKTPKKVAGTVQEVDFRDYVGVVIAAEWPEHYPIETLKAGAIAVKQYGWFYTRVYRGKTVKVDGERVCYDVIDNTIDQVYYPERWTASRKHHKAINSTWDITLRKYKASTKSSKFFMTGYRNGTSGTCGAEVTGYKLYQRGAKDCGANGLTFREILSIYLKPRLEIVQHGRHDIIGTKHGDAAALIKVGDNLVAHVWTPGVAPPEPGSRAGARISAADMVGYRASDVNRDGLDDLVWVKKTGAKSGRVRVALSGGTDYAESAIWFDGDLKVPLSRARLLVGDFDADGRRDIALLGPGNTAGRAALYVLRKKTGDAFDEPVKWWSGSLDLDAVRSVWAADVTGDGYADLVVREDLAAGGVSVSVAVNESGADMGSLKVRFKLTSLSQSTTKMIAADANRDGREDLLMLIGGDGPTRVQRLQGKAGGGFKRVHIWKAPSADPIPVKKTRLGAADVDYDGRTDLVLFTKNGEGTRIRVLKTRYTSMKAGPDSTHDSLDWKDVRPY
jgi:hypothetical protein